MKYKVGDRVRIKSLDWYNENEENGIVLVENGDYMFCKSDTEWCGRIVTIKEICLNEYYRIVEDFGKYRWTDEMIDCLVEEEKLLCEGCCSLELKYNKLTIADNICTDKVEIILQDYELKKEGDKWFAVKKKKEYPNNFYHCVRTLGLHSQPADASKYKTELIRKLQTLLVCRDAYWKIAGEEMGLGKPWEPDWGNDDHESYPAIVACGGKIIKSSIYTHDNPFAFPTEEMRDAFYENFKELIEECKEFL